MPTTADLRAATDEKLVAELDRLDAQRQDLKKQALAIKAEIARRGTESQIVSRLSSGQVLPPDQEKFLHGLDEHERQALAEKVDLAMQKRSGAAASLVAKLLG